MSVRHARSKNVIRINTVFVVVTALLRCDALHHAGHERLTHGM